MGVFEDVIVKAKGAADAAGKKTGEIVELSRLKFSLSEFDQKINGEYRELGKIVYTSAKDNADCTEFVKTKAEKIDSLFCDREKLQSRINEMMRKKPCPECQYENPESALFCQKCGTKL